MTATSTGERKWHTGAPPTDASTRTMRVTVCGGCRQEFHTACRSVFELDVAEIADELIDGLFVLLSEGKDAIDLHELILFLETAAKDLPKFAELGAARFRVYRARHRPPVHDSVRAAPPPRFLVGTQVGAERNSAAWRVPLSSCAAKARFGTVDARVHTSQAEVGASASAEVTAETERLELMERMWLRMVARPDPAAALYALLDECAPWADPDARRTMQCTTSDM